MSIETIISLRGLPTDRQVIARAKARKAQDEDCDLRQLAGRTRMHFRTSRQGFTPTGYKFFSAGGHDEQRIAMSVAAKLLRTAVGRYAAGATPQATRGVGVINDRSVPVERLAKLVAAYATSTLHNHQTHKVIVTVSGTTEKPALTLVLLGREPSIKYSTDTVYGYAPRWKVSL